VHRFGRGQAWERPESTSVPAPRTGSTVAVVCAMDSLTHDVFDKDLATVTSGRYRALCGEMITAAPMSQPEGRQCEACTAARTPAPPRRSSRLRPLRRLA
jgi:hypothetical protein